MPGTKYISINNHNGKEFIFNLNRYLTEDTSNTMNFKNIASYLSDEILKFVGNKAKGRISKRVFQESKARQNF